MLCFVPGGGGSSASDIDNKRCNFPDLVKLPSPEPDIKFGRLLEDTDQHNIGKNPHSAGNITFILPDHNSDFRDIFVYTNCLQITILGLAMLLSTFIIYCGTSQGSVVTPSVQLHLSVDLWVIPLSALIPLVLHIYNHIKYQAASWNLVLWNMYMCGEQNHSRKKVSVSLVLTKPPPHICFLLYSWESLISELWTLSPDISGYCNSLYDYHKPQDRGVNIGWALQND